MVAKIEIQECLRDSPKFRQFVEEEEQSIDQLEQKLEKIIKVCTSMIEAGKSYVGQQSLFANSLWDLSVHFKADSDVLSALNKLIHSLQEMNKFHTTLLDQASRTILRNLNLLVKDDIKSVKEHKHHFEKISNEFDNVLLRNAHVPRSKVQEVEEVQNIMQAVRSCFSHQALTYVNSIYVLQSKKRHEILSTLLSYMHACSAYYHQGNDLCEDLRPFFKTLADDVTKMRDETYKIQKEVDSSHGLVSQFDAAPTILRWDSKSSKLEGYLFKRTSNAFKTWNRRWFYLCENKLVYRRRTGDEHETVMEDDLRLCTVKPVCDGERRYCFEVVSPSKSHVLQADSEEMYSLWIEALQKTIGAAIQRMQTRGHDDKGSGHGENKNETRAISKPNNNNKVQKLRLWEHILRIPGNNYCADCKSVNPHWASINLGVVLCIECSGVHRSLGVHYSKVRSLTLDDWEPEVVKVMTELGNNVVNEIYEANVPENIDRPSEFCVGSVREEWIRLKYVEKKFVIKLSEYRDNLEESKLKEVQREDMLEDVPECDKEEAGNGQQGTSAATKGPHEQAEPPDIDLETFLKNLMDFSGQDGKEQQNSEDTGCVYKESTNEHSNLLLYKAASSHKLPLMCLAFALGANKGWTNVQDKGRQPLHAAVLSGSVVACAYLLLNGARINAQDEEGSTPLHLATVTGHTQQVCLFLKYRADQHLEDKNGKLPLTIAEEKEHADIVTLLRLGRLNEEMKDPESGVSGDDMFNDVVRDFSRLTYTNSSPFAVTKP